MKQLIKKSTVFITLIAFTFSLAQPLAYAGMIETDAVLSNDARANVLDKTERFLHRQHVAQTLVKLGVNEQSVMQRVRTLTDEELAHLSRNIDHAPAGSGVLEVIGVLFIVLLILELVGVTDIFKRL